MDGGRSIRNKAKNCNTAFVALRALVGTAEFSVLHLVLEFCIARDFGRYRNRARLHSGAYYSFLGGRQAPISKICYCWVTGSEDRNTGNLLLRDQSLSHNTCMIIHSLSGHSRRILFESRILYCLFGTCIRFLGCFRRILAMTYQNTRIILQ